MTPSYGPRTSIEEYVAQVRSLHEDAARGRLSAEEVARTEIDLTIDHRLGVDFPARRREELRATMERVSGLSVWTMALWILSLVHPEWSWSLRVRLLLRAYAPVLSLEETEELLGLRREE